MFTDQYYHTLKRSQAFQQNSVNWAGYGSYQYADQLRSIVRKYNCKTMLDYGCGKGLQYTSKNNFADLIGIDQYALHDPAYDQYAVLPDGTWDIVICLDVLPFIPESDIDLVIGLILSRCNKICVIGLQEITKTKSKKPLVCVHDHTWWQEKLLHDRLQLIWYSADEPFDYSAFL
jgi:2-polyprenyl-3-methyl-5-hydroxy-6-metoxy-1,4-benzoquinol methylase